VEQASKIKQVLCSYELGTCQLINPAKCSMLFGSACVPDDQEKVKAMLRVGNICWS
jgi:hypothetical protein